MIGRALLRRSVRDFVPAGPLGYAGAKYLPTKVLPANLFYDFADGRIKVRPEVATAMAFATQAPSTWVSLTTTGSTAGNRTALQNAINTAIAASGTAGVHAVRGIKVQKGVEWGQQVDLQNVALLDNNGIGVHLVIATVEATGLLRAPGQRVGTEDRAQMAQFGITTFNEPCFKPGPLTRRVRLVGLDMRTDPTVLASLRAGAFGFPGTGAQQTFTYTGFVGWDATDYSGGGGGVRNTAGTPADITIDRCILQGDDEIRYRRCMLANFDKLRVLDSYLECAGDPNNSDSQVVGITSCAGDHLFVNSALAGAWGEDIMYGGGGTGGVQWLPKNIGVVRCYFFMPARWGPTQQNRLNKNRFELKIGEECAIVECYVQDYYGFGRLGNQRFAFVFKCTDQFAGEAFVRTQNVTVRGCLFDRCSGILGINAWDGPSIPPHKAARAIEMSHCVALPFSIAGLGMPQAQSGVDIVGGSLNVGPGGDAEYWQVVDITLNHNSLSIRDGATSYESGLRITMPGSPAATITRMRITNNVFAIKDSLILDFAVIVDKNGATNGITTGWGDATKVECATGNNVMSGFSDPAASLLAAWGATNRGVTAYASLNLDPATMAPLAGSPAIGAASDGGNAGADLALVNTMLANVITGRP
jgi:hypothetical protein